MEKSEIKACLIKFKERTFAIIEVSRDIIDDEAKALAFIKQHSFLFPRHPIVLISFHTNGKPILYGKPELIELLMLLKIEKIPWKIYRYQKR